jgi:hypothetical protein
MAFSTMKAVTRSFSSPFLRHFNLAKAAICSPAARPGRYFDFCSAVPNSSSAFMPIDW